MGKNPTFSVQTRILAQIQISPFWVGSIHGNRGKTEKGFFTKESEKVEISIFLEVKKTSKLIITEENGENYTRMTCSESRNSSNNPCVIFPKQSQLITVRSGGRNDIEHNVTEMENLQRAWQLGSNKPIQTYTHLYYFK